MIKHENRLFANDVPFQVLQNLVTALDPSLLTEHTVMLLFHDLSHSFPVEELPHRLLEVIAEYYHDDETPSDDQTPKH